MFLFKLVFSLICGVEVLLNSLKRCKKEKNHFLHRFTLERNYFLNKH